MKKIIIPAILALLFVTTNCKKEDKKPTEETPPVTETGNTNPAATSNNGIVIASMTFGGSVSMGKMVKIDLGSKTTTDIGVPYVAEENFDVSPDGKKVAYMQHKDTLAFIYSLETGAKTGLLLKNSTFDFPTGIHFNNDGSKLLFFIKGKIYSIDPNGNVNQTPVVVSTMDSQDGPGGPFTWNADATKFIANGFSGRTNTEAHNICVVDVATGQVKRVSNGIDVIGQGFGKEITQAQNTHQANANTAVIAQNGMYGNATYGYRGWTLDGNIYYHSNKNVYQVPGQSPQGTVVPVLYNLASPTTTENSADYTGMRILQKSGDGKKYIALTTTIGAKLKVFNTSDNSEVVDLTSIQNAATWVVGIRFANK